MSNYKIVEWLDNKIRIIDQRKLPHEVVYPELHNYQEVIDAIKSLAIRGAPDIGVAAAYGFALGAQSINTTSKQEFLNILRRISQAIASARPTAVNLVWAVERMNKIANRGNDVHRIKSELIEEAKRIDQENDNATLLLSKYGAELIQHGSTILTHCNAGSLATASYGTALGVIKMAAEQGKEVEVFADETRPLLQGARLTAWEMLEEHIPLTLITDNMAGHFMSRGYIDCCIVGADRIAANGDTANKIGTYSIAVLAKENNIPFYVAAPVSTIDMSISSGEEIPIEERDPEEVTNVLGSLRIAPYGVKAANPAFDVTPHRYISAIITEAGVFREPYDKNMSNILGW